MKKLCLCLALVLMLPLLAACGAPSTPAVATPGVSEAPEVPTWQSQYDLGLRLLSEGNYEEAIIAFTAAIEIDPKQAPAYVGRGDVYVQLAVQTAESGNETESGDYYAQAEPDYQAALGLDALIVAVYEKLADIYLALGDTDAARAILQQGYDATGDETLRERLESMFEDERSETVTVEAVIFWNPELYSEAMDSYWRQYQLDTDDTRVSIDSYCVRFPAPVQFVLQEETISINEAAMFDTAVFDHEAELFNHATQTTGSLIGVPLILTGYFERHWQTTEFGGPVTSHIPHNDGYTYYFYRPNGDYCFRVLGYELIS